jgi:phosphatidylglycerophosphate synthase
MPLIPLVIENAMNRVLNRVAHSPIFSRVSPNIVSTLGVVFGVTAAILFARGAFLAAGCFLALSGTLDLLDGKIARSGGRSSVFGAVYDATLDRATELAVFTGIGGYFILRDMHWTSLVVVFAAGGSWLVSYVRARAESYGVKCHVGFLRRGERFVLLAAGAILTIEPNPFHEVALWIIRRLQLQVRYAFPPMPLTLVIFLLAILSQITIVQRLVHVWKVTRATPPQAR